MNGPPSIDALIRRNRDLLARAAVARRAAQRLVHGCRADRLLDVRCRTAWRMAMAEWAAGLRDRPPKAADDLP